MLFQRMTSSPRRWEDIRVGASSDARWLGVKPLRNGRVQYVSPLDVRDRQRRRKNRSTR